MLKQIFFYPFFPWSFFIEKGFAVWSSDVHFSSDMHIVNIVDFLVVNSVVVVQLRWFPSKKTHHRFPMKLGMLMLRDKEMLKT